MRKLVHSSLYWGKVVVLGIIVGVGIQFAEAWTNPSVSAPGGNVAGPINTGVFNQVKNASLGLIGNLASGLVQLNTVVVEGTPCPSNGLIARDTIGKILACQNLVWTYQEASITAPVWVHNYSTLCTTCLLAVPLCSSGDWHPLRTQVGDVFTYAGTGRCSRVDSLCKETNGYGRGGQWFVYKCTQL